MKLGALIPIRMASSRLPAKALRQICGKPVVSHLLDRVFASRYLDKKDVIVCTTPRADDDPLVAAVENYGARVFRGSEDDIIHRFYHAMKQYGFEAVVQVDGDDILCATEYMDLTMEKLLSDSGLDIVTCKGLPLGIACKSFTMKAMEKVFAHYKTERNDTGFIYFFTKTTLCQQAVIGPVSPDHILDEARLTLDYEEDFELFRRILEGLQREGGALDLASVVRLLKANPEWMKINSSLNEQYWARTAQKAQLEYRDTDGAVRKVAL